MIRNQISEHHHVIGRDFRLVKDDEVLEQGDQTAIVSELLSLEGGMWSRVLSPDFGKKVIDWLEGDSERLVRRRKKPHPMKNYVRPKQLKCPCGSPILSPPICFEERKLSECHENTCTVCGQRIIMIINRAGNTSISPIPPLVPKNQFKLTILEPTHAIGVAGITDIYVKKDDQGYEVRMGFAVMGQANCDACVGANPFDPNFHDNYITGKGKVLEEALVNLSKEQKNIQDTLWE